MSNICMATNKPFDTAIDLSRIIYMGHKDWVVLFDTGATINLNEHTWG